MNAKITFEGTLRKLIGTRHLSILDPDLSNNVYFSSIRRAYKFNDFNRYVNYTDCMIYEDKINLLNYVLENEFFTELSIEKLDREVDSKIVKIVSHGESLYNKGFVAFLVKKNSCWAYQLKNCEIPTSSTNKMFEYNFRMMLDNTYQSDLASLTAARDFLRILVGKKDILNRIENDITEIELILSQL